MFNRRGLLVGGLVASVRLWTGSVLLDLVPIGSAGSYSLPDSYPLPDLDPSPEFITLDPWTKIGSLVVYDPEKKIVYAESFEPMPITDATKILCRFGCEEPIVDIAHGAIFSPEGVAICRRDFTFRLLKNDSIEVTWEFRIEPPDA